MNVIIWATSIGLLLCYYCHDHIEIGFPMLPALEFLYDGIMLVLIVAAASVSASDCARVCNRVDTGISM
jgi:hypothetical protein